MPLVCVVLKVSFTTAPKIVMMKDNLPMNRVRARGPSARARLAGVVLLFYHSSFPAYGVTYPLWAAKKPPRASRRRKNPRNALNNLTIRRWGSLRAEHFDFVSQTIEVIFVKYTAVFYVRFYMSWNRIFYLPGGEWFVRSFKQIFVRMAVLFYCDLVSISARGAVIYTSINSNDDSVCVSCHSVYRKL